MDEIAPVTIKYMYVSIFIETNAIHTNASLLTMMR